MSADTAKRRGALRWDLNPAFALLLAELRARRRTLGRIALWSVVEAAPALLSGLLVAAATDRFRAGDPAGGTAALLLFVGTAAVGAFATRALFPALAAVVEPVRDAFLTAAVKGAVAGGVAAAARSTAVADTTAVSRVGEQVEIVREALFTLLRLVRQIAFSGLAAVIGLALLAPAAGAIAAAAAVLAAAVFVPLVPRLARRQRAVLLAEERVAGAAGATFAGIHDAIACGGQARAVGDLDRAVERHAAAVRALSRITALRAVVVFAGAQLPVIALLVAAPVLLRRGQLSPGELVGAVTYVAYGLEPALRKLVEVLATWGMEMAVVTARLGETFSAEGTAARPRRVAGPRHDLRVNGLTFAYGSDATPVVRDLTFGLPEGAHLAVVGPSGIGKSTLANLLSGLLLPQRGTVHVGGVAVGDPAAGAAVGLIPQEAYVFAGTLRENLAYLAPSAGDVRLAAATEAVGLAAVVERLGGLGARVGPGGATLSGGERQLVALARMYLSPARVVVLDEATAELDPVAEERAERAFAAREGSLVVIAHRISSAQRAGTVLLFDGETARLGHHDELLRTSALYADLTGHWNQPELLPRGGTS